MGATGTYWNLGKRNAVKQLTAGVMEAHWRAARRSLDGFAGIGVGDDFPTRLFAAAAPDSRAPTRHPKLPRPKRRRTARHELPAPRLLRRVVVHARLQGGEPLLRAPREWAIQLRAACDFQWAGLGVGACDVVYLLTTSLRDGLLAEREADLLQHYRRAVVREMVYAPRHGSTSTRSLCSTSRFCPRRRRPRRRRGDRICARADALLGRLEAAATGERAAAPYDAVLAAAPGPFVG